MKLGNSSLAKKFNLYTIIAVYFLILVGGIVRSTGAGMGCPDWPKCFGGYIPPSSVSELPENYEDVYVESRVKKNQRLATSLSALGMERLAERVLSDPQIHETTYYDPQKAWIEYFNRVVGVIIGFFVILNMIFAFAYKKENKWIPVLGVMSFVLVVFQGWVGSLVVSTNLLPGFISFHMLLALLLVALLLIQMFQMQNKHRPLTGKGLIGIILFLFTVQIVLGTQVREQMDTLRDAGLAKGDWIANLGSLFYFHRSYSVVLVVLIGWLLYRNYKRGFKHIGLTMLAYVVILEIIFGMVLAYFSVPAFAQPIHLFLGSLAFGVLFYLFLQSYFNKEIA